MNLRQASLGATVVLLLLGNIDRVRAAGDFARTATAKRTIVLRTSDLRSAYLIRSGEVHYDASDLSPAGLRRQLQRHFDTVTVLLQMATPQSIELALDRLEAAEQQTWSVSERESWRRRLLINRQMQLTRLTEYRNRGLFPQNKCQAPQPVPIFVDEHDTACAVGHLMRLSGRERDVANIQHEHNLVHVPDVAAGPVVAWTLTSGLTIEEAALIQPAYGPILPPIPDDAFEVEDDTASFVFGKLRYSNFRTYSASDGGIVPEVNIPVVPDICTEIICFIAYPAPEILVPTHFATSLEPPRVVVEFDVEVTAPNLRIASRPAAEKLSGWFTRFLPDQIQLFAKHEPQQLWVDYPLKSFPEYRFEEPRRSTLIAGEGFQPTTHMTIVTEIAFGNTLTHQAQTVFFDIVAVPEPATAALAVLALGWAGTMRRRRDLF